MSLFKIATIADLHINAQLIDIIYEQLEKVFLKYIRDHSLDMIVFAGDFYDSIISLNSRSAYVSMEFMRLLLEICKKNDIRYIRLLQGTLSHDNNQLVNFKIFENDKDINFRVIEQVEEEVIEDLNILYVPEEYMVDPEKYYEEFLNSGKRYDFIFGHGMFKEVSFQASKQESAVTLSKAPVFDSKKFIDICDGLILFGHIHNGCTIKDKIIYIGSFSRWIYGEECDKGFLVTVYNKEDKTYINEFIVNDLAKRYDTCKLIDIDKYINSPEILVRELDMFKVDNLRIQIILTEGKKDYSYILNFVKEYYSNTKGVKLDIVNKNKVLEEQEIENKVNNIMKKYRFVFDKNIPHEEKISRFIKIKHGKNVDPNRIKDRLYIQK